MNNFIKEYNTSKNASFWTTSFCVQRYGEEEYKRSQCILQRKPRRSTPAQRAMRHAFGQRYQGAHHSQSPFTNNQSSPSFPVAPP